MKIKDKLFVVTGAAQGLGRAISLKLAEQGAALAVLDVNAEVLEETRLACIAAGARCESFICNVADEASVIDAFTRIEKQLGPLSGLVNNAGILRDALLVKAKDGEIVDRLSLEQWQQVIDVNLTGVFLCGREAATYLIRQQQPGVVINISSISRAGNAGQSNYAAAKAGVAALTTTWAKELARYNIRCAAIAPGVFETEMVTSMKEEAHARITGAIPLRRTGALDELADTVQYIIENDYFNGRVLELDGGLRL
ncbi:MAG: 3-oxoacyl-[acyl-carrier protein] reductase [Planctomycetota bacterium]